MIRFRPLLLSRYLAQSLCLKYTSTMIISFRALCYCQLGCFAHESCRWSYALARSRIMLRVVRFSSIYIDETISIWLFSSILTVASLIFLARSPCMMLSRALAKSTWLVLSRLLIHSDLLMLSHQITALHICCKSCIMARSFLLALNLNFMLNQILCC